MRQRSPCSRTASREEPLGPVALEDVDLLDSKDTEQDWGSVQACDQGMLDSDRSQGRLFCLLNV